MMPTPASLQSRLNTTFIWTLKERDPETGLFVPRLVRKNVETNFGLTAYAGAFQGNYTAPVYMVIDNFAPTLVSLAGTTLVLAASTQPTLSSDTQLQLSIGTANQEVVGFSGTPTFASGQYTYTLSTTPVNAHNVGDVCVRQPTANDTMTAIFSEQQYDSVNFPNQRMQSVGGFSPGTAQWTMQYFFTGTQALLFFSTVGLADALTIGTGNLHNLLPLGFNHTGTTNDLELDVSLTLSNI